MNIQSLHFSLDINRDGSYSLWEYWEAIKFLYRLPGNLIVEGLGHVPYLAPLLHIQASQDAGYGSLDGLLSVTLSLLFWIIVVFGILTLASPVSDETDDTSVDSLAPSSQVPTVAIAADDSSDLAAMQPVQAPGHFHTHRPVSRSSYSIPGKQPKRRHWHRLAHSLFGHAK